jgi:hypothetical protein
VAAGTPAQILNEAEVLDAPHPVELRGAAAHGHGRRQPPFDRDAVDRHQEGALGVDEVRAVRLERHHAPSRLADQEGRMGRGQELSFVRQPRVTITEPREELHEGAAELRSVHSVCRRGRQLLESGTVVPVLQLQIRVPRLEGVPEHRQVLEHLRMSERLRPRTPHETEEHHRHQQAKQTSAFSIAGHHFP